MIRKKLITKNKITIFLIVIIGILMGSFASLIAGRADKLTTAKIMDNTFDTLKQQCINYDKIMSLDETKSLFRLIDKTTELRQDLSRDSSLLSRDYLREYCEEQSISGIILLDNKAQKAISYNESGNPTYDSWKSLIASSKIQDIVENPVKIFSQRVEKEGHHYDVAAVARKDRSGVIFTYYQQDKELLDNETDEMLSLLNGFRMEKNGTFLIVKGKTVLASNDSSMTGHLSRKNSIYSQLKYIPSNQKKVNFVYNKRGYYGAKARCNGYILYMYFPHFSMYSTTKQTFILFIFFYTSFWLIFFIAKTKVLHNEQKKLSQVAKEAQRANKTKTEFLRRISHDIRTPINGIQGMIKIADACPDDLEKQAMCRNKIRISANFLLSLVNDVLDMSKLETDEFILESKPFCLSHIIKEIDYILETQASQLQIHYTSKIQPMEVDHFIGSPLHIQQIILNICSNALKYSKPNGNILFTSKILTIQENTAVYEFTCQDDGIGMSKEFQKHMFEPFMQEHDNARTTYAGTGLGLAIVHKLIHKMNGSIEVHSKKDEGTSFLITLPLTIDTEYTHQEDHAHETRDNLLQGIHILLVEDNEINMEISEFLLEVQGASVTKAWNGQEAIALFEESEIGYFQIILMDIMMPVVNGKEATAKIRNLSREDAKTIPIIAMTANAYTEDIQQNLQAGMNDHISKPIDETLLLHILEKYL